MVITHRANQRVLCVAAELQTNTSRLDVTSLRLPIISAHLGVNLAHTVAFSIQCRVYIEPARTPFNDRVLWLLGFLMPFR